MPAGLFFPHKSNSPQMGPNLWFKRGQESSNLICFTGDSAYAVPHTNKLHTRVNHIWVNRRRQLNRSAMEEPLPGRTALMITVSPVPGKYDLYKICILYIPGDRLICSGV